MSKIKVNYKALKRKHGIIETMDKYASGLCITIMSLGILGTFAGILYAISYFGNMSFVDAFVCFVGIFSGLVLLFGIIEALYCFLTYIRMLFRLTYLPLTEDDAKTLHINVSPILFLEALKEMICYKRNFETFSSFNDDNVELELSQLFYTLFFNNDEAIIYEYLTNKDGLKNLYDALTVKRKLYLEIENAPLLKHLSSLRNLVEYLLESDENVTKVTLAHDDSINEWKVHVIIKTDKDIYLLSLYEEEVIRCENEEEAMEFVNKHC